MRVGHSGNRAGHALLELSEISDVFVVTGLIPLHLSLMLDYDTQEVLDLGKAFFGGNAYIHILTGGRNDLSLHQGMF